MFNQVIYNAWKEFTLISPPIIVRAFEKTRLCPLKPPKEDKNIGSLSLIASMQCAEGKKASELEILTNESMGTTEFVEDEFDKKVDLLSIH